MRGPHPGLGELLGRAFRRTPCGLALADADQAVVADPGTTPMIEGRSSRRQWLDRGTTRNPGPHLDRLPVGLELSAINLAEGLRAAVASGSVLVASVWFQSSFLLIAALAANLACFCDAGGLLRSRLVSVIGFTALGALSWVSFGLLRNEPWWLVAAAAAPFVFLCSMARIWGASAQAVGNVLIVALALAIDAPLSGRAALSVGVAFLAGGSWAAILTLAIWRIRPTLPAEQAVELAWFRLAALTQDLRRLIAGNAPQAQWDAHARTHRRAARAMIEEARTMVFGTVRTQSFGKPHIRHLLVRTEMLESVFAALIALSDHLEGQPSRLVVSSGRMLRRLRPMLHLCGRDLPGGLTHIEPAIARWEKTGAGTAALEPLVHQIANGIRAAMRREPDVAIAFQPVGGEQAVPFVTAAWAPLRANLAWESAILRHAARATIVTVPALAWSLLVWSPFAHWLTITVALTMQPYFAATWQRLLERVGGTLLGGLLGAAVSFLPATPLAKALMLVPLSVVGFSVRQVSYGAFIACLTPLVVVLFDVAVPGHSDATIAAMRFLYTVAGGVLAIGACALLWPSWEPDRLVTEIKAALRAFGAFADAGFAYSLGDGPQQTVAQARRSAGVANNNLEASLSRALQEPGRHLRPELASGLLIDAALRRLGGTLTTFEQDVSGVEALDPSLVRQWRHWTTTTLTDLTAGLMSDRAPPALPPPGVLARLQTSVAAIRKAMADGRMVQASGA